MHLNTKRIVITGGPSTGKTVVIDQLEALGYHCLEEVIRAMTKKEKAEDKNLTFKINPIISVTDPMAFNKTILKARVDQYNSTAETTDEFVFFDRGIPDVLAYMDCFDQKYDATFKDACTANKYDLVFLMPPWKEIYTSDNERFETYEEALRINECLLNSYTHLGYDVQQIPKDSILNRVDFILNRIKEKR